MNRITPSTQRLLQKTASAVCVFLLCFIEVNAQAWEYLTPIKSNSEIRGCSFLDEQRGIAVILATRSVFRTMDGGETWENMWTPGVNSNPTDVEWVTEDLLFITAGNGDLFRSLDGGNTWANVNPPTAMWLYSVHFINETTGFVTGESGTILKTTDGGSTWMVIPSAATARLYGIHFTDDNNGTIVGWNGTILRTSDGGDSWSLISTSITANLQDVHFIDANTGFTCGGVIAKTVDGGLTWNQVYSAAGDYFYVLHVNANGQGYAAGNMGAFIKTSNFGQTWQSQPDLGGGNGDIFCGDHISTDAAYLMGELNIYKSTTGGSSWTIIKNAIQGGGITAVQFQSDTMGTAVSVASGGTFYGGIAQTSNGGKLWDLRQTSTSGGWYAVDFPTQQTGYVLGTTNLGKTTNGGQTWTYSTSPTLTATCLEFIDAQTGFAGGFGNASNICKTTNSGTSFTCGTNIGASDIHFIDSQRGIAVRNVQGGGDTYYKTFDGGNTWEYHNGVIGSTIYFYDDSLGFVGSQGGVFRTMDSGTTWDFQYVGGGQILDIKFYNENLGFCVSDYAELYKTEDGGDTWTLVLQSYISNFGASTAHFTDNYCYIGSGGDIYRTELGCGTFELGNITGDQEWCEGVYGQLVCEQVAGATSYQWQLPEGWTGATNNRIIQPLPSATGGLATVTVTNGCGLTDSTSISVSVTERVDSVFAIMGPSVMCEGTSAIFTIAADENATEYNWQSTAFTSLENANTIELIAGTQDFYISVQTSNECGTSNYSTLTVSVPGTSTSPANYNGDCLINEDDLVLLIDQFGCLNDCDTFDLNNDGFVGVDDILLFIELSAQ
jgi:photosystem II stability/assembly factor-like uncharacterized protein